MKVLVFGNNKRQAEELLKKSDIEMTEKDPDAVISFGGDGTLMKAEHAHPGIPKLVLKDSAICKVCSNLPNETVLDKFKSGGYKIRELIKLEAHFDGKTIKAVNDIIVHNADPRHAIRYHLRANQRQLGGTIIGDGIVVATPFGSTAYYRSITDSFFETGIGVAFNNSTEQIDHVVLDDSSALTLEVIRGPVAIYADNQEEYFKLAEGDTVTIKKSVEVFKWIEVNKGP